MRVSVCHGIASRGYLHSSPSGLQTVTLSKSIYTLGTPIFTKFPNSEQTHTSHCSSRVLCDTPGQTESESPMFFFRRASVFCLVAVLFIQFLHALSRTILHRHFFNVILKNAYATYLLHAGKNIFRIRPKRVPFDSLPPDDAYSESHTAYVLRLY